MQVIIPMSGHGERFRRAGYTLPKPLIPIDDRPMIAYVMRMFPGATDVSFICNEEHLKNTNMRAILEQLCGGAKIYAIPEHKLGPVYAVHQIQQYIRDDLPVIVNYCDFYAHWDFVDFKKRVAENGCDGCVLAYKGFHPHLLGPNYYASIKVDAQNNLQEIREKYSFTEDKMQSWQSSGTYYFRTGEIVKKYFAEAIATNVHCNKEFYVSLIYNLLQRDGLRTWVYPQDYFCQWGTPDDLADYLRWSKYFRKLVEDT